jgi:hypothetical protein
MEGTSAPLMLGLASRVQERPVNFFGQAQTLPTFGALIATFSMGELRETGGAWPLWLGFFCFKNCPQQLRQLNNTHSNPPLCFSRRRLSAADKKKGPQLARWECGAGLAQWAHLRPLRGTASGSGTPTRRIAMMPLSASEDRTEKQCSIAEMLSRCSANHRQSNKRKTPARGHRGLGEYDAKAISGGRGTSLNVLSTKRSLAILGSVGRQIKNPGAGAPGALVSFWGNLCDAREQHHFAQIYTLTGKNYSSRQTKLISRAC